MIFKTFKKSFLLPEIQTFRTVYFLSLNFLFNFKKKRRKCLYSSRFRALISTTRSSRHNFRTFYTNGNLAGIKKYSW